MDESTEDELTSLCWRGPLSGYASHDGKLGDGGCNLWEVTFYVHSTHFVCLAAGFHGGDEGLDRHGGMEGGDGVGECTMYHTTAASAAGASQVASRHRQATRTNKNKHRKKVMMMRMK